MGLFDLSGKTAVVTGGTRGIGAAIAVGLARAGADIVLIQRHNSDTTTSQTIMELGRRCAFFYCDLADTTQVSELIPTLLLPQLPNLPNGNIHILVNAAGIQAPHLSHEFPTAHWNSVLQTSLSSLFTVSRDIAAHWVATGTQGSIINITSLMSYQGGLHVPEYAAAKHGVVGLTKAMSNELAGKGIRANAIAPGYVETDTNVALREDEVLMKVITGRIPMGRWGKAEDFAGPAIFLASKAAGYVTGETLVVDGGWMAQ